MVRRRRSHRRRSRDSPRRSSGSTRSRSRTPVIVVRRRRSRSSATTCSWCSGRSRCRPDGESVRPRSTRVASARFLLTLRFTPSSTSPRSPSAGTASATGEATLAGLPLYVLLDEIVTTATSRGREPRGRRRRPGGPGVRRGRRRAGHRRCSTKLFRLRRDVVRLRRRAAPMRAGGPPPVAGVMSPELAPYYRDVVDHVIRVRGDGRQRPRPDMTALLEVRVAQVGQPAEPGDEEDDRVGGHHPASRR